MTIKCTCLTSWCFVVQQPCLNTTQVQSYQDESYVPMASPSPSVTTIECDGYIPMSPGTFSFHNTNCNFESSTTLSTPMHQPGDVAPPPIHRHLKPRLRRGESHNSLDWFMWHFLTLCRQLSLYFYSANQLRGWGSSWCFWVCSLCYTLNRVYKCNVNDRIHADIRYTDFSTQWALLLVTVWNLALLWHTRELQSLQ